MELKDALVIVFVIMLLCLISCWTNKREGFSLEKKPFEEDNTLFLRNPYDNIDYVTPVFEKIWSKK